MGSVLLTTIATSVTPPAGFGPADWAVIDLASGSGGLGQLAVDVLALPAKGSLPINRILYRAGSVNEPWAELVGPADVAQIVTDPAGTLPWRQPLPFDVPSGVPIKVWLAAEDSHGNRGPISAIKTQTATEGAGLAAPTAIQLSATAFSEATGVGTAVATITADGSPAPDFTLTSDPDGKFRIEGGSLVLDAAVDVATATSHQAGITATNSEGSVTQAFALTVTAETGGTTPSTAIYADVIGPAAEVAEIQVYVTPSNPDFTVTNWAELDAALAAASAGDVILCRAGQYGDNRTLSKTNTGAEIRVCSDGYLAARFDRLTVGGRGIAVEGVKVAGELRFSRATAGAMRHCQARRHLNGSSVDCLVEDCVFDHEFSWGSQIKPWNSTDTRPNALVFRRTIFCRGGGIEIDLFQATACHDLTFEHCVFFDNRVPSGSSFHADLFQCFSPHTSSGTQRWKFHRCMFFTYTLSDIRGNQGLFLSDGSYRGVDLKECLFGPPNSASRQLVIQNAHGTIRNVTVLNDPISGENKTPGTNANLTVIDSLAQSFLEQGGGPPGTSSGNLYYGSSLGAYFDTTPSNGLPFGSDWRHFRDTAGLTIGAAPFLDYLAGKWG